MIVRIAGEGRWTLADDLGQQLYAEDSRLMHAVDDRREADYELLLLALCRFVRQHGTRIGIDDFDDEAHITVPSPDMSLAETIDLLAKRPNLPS